MTLRLSDSATLTDSRLSDFPTLTQTPTATGSGSFSMWFSATGNGPGPKPWRAAGGSLPGSRPWRVWAWCCQGFEPGAARQGFEPGKPAARAGQLAGNPPGLRTWQAGSLQLGRQLACLACCQLIKTAFSVWQLVSIPPAASKHYNRVFFHYIALSKNLKVYRQ